MREHMAGEFGGLTEEIKLYARLKHEQGAMGVQSVLKDALAKLKRLPDDPELLQAEPDSLPAIRRLRPKGPRRIWERFDREKYLDRLQGALLARFAGCTLGAPVEGSAVDRMERLARENGQKFPPTEYWTRVSDPLTLRYSRQPRGEYTRDRMDGVPVDDDIAYTMLGLLVAEEYGPDFTVADNGRAWLKHLPLACTAEKIALANLKKGVSAEKAALKDNPYCQWIGADIRADPWGYMAPGWPEFAADMAYRDAILSHRRNGVYGEMFFAAAIAAAFAVNDTIEAIEIGLTEIPRECDLAKNVRWALKVAPRIRDYKDASAAARERFRGMSVVHTINNACLTVWGLAIGGRDVGKVIGETVAMGLDNDCTAATAGSLVGAVVGRRGVPAKWTRPFHNTICTYLMGGRKLKVPPHLRDAAKGAKFIGSRRFRIDDVVRRFAAQAARVHLRSGGNL